MTLVDAPRATHSPPVVAPRSRSAQGPLKVSLVAARTEGYKSAPDAMAAIALAIRGGADVVVAPEWLFVAGKDPKGFVAIVDQLRKLTVGSKALVVPGSIAMCDAKGRYRNVAIALCDGRAVYTYAKRHEGGDGWVGSALGAKYWQAGERPSVFTWRDLRVGLEICADHYACAAKRDLEELGQPRLDLQIVVACGAAFYPHAMAVRENGAVLVVDGAGPRVRALRNQRGELMTRPAQRQEACGTACIHHISL